MSWDHLGSQEIADGLSIARAFFEDCESSDQVGRWMDYLLWKLTRFRGQLLWTLTVIQRLLLPLLRVDITVKTTAFPLPIREPELNFMICLFP